MGEAPLDCLVIGGGVIGMAAAREVARTGRSVALLERRSEPGAEATAAAAGMLAAAAEAHSPGPFFDLARRSADLWSGWAELLLAESGVDVEYQECGLLRVTTSAEVVGDLEIRRTWQLAQGMEVSGLLNLEELRQEVPQLGPDVVAGLHYPKVAHVHSHRVAEALALAGSRAGVRLQLSAEVTGVRPSGDLLEVSAGAERHLARRVVLATGSWGEEILRGLGVDLCPEPVRGQMLALRPRGLPLPEIVFGDLGYVLQKRSGLVLAGATEERVGYLAETTLEGVARLAAMARSLIPELGQAQFSGAWAGLRPFLESGPVIGPLPQDERVILALGHFRNGILLAPVTAQLVREALEEGHEPVGLRAFSPRHILGG
jgi:glycine oxidase